MPGGVFFWVAACRYQVNGGYGGFIYAKWPIGAVEIVFCGTACLIVFGRYGVEKEFCSGALVACPMSFALAFCIQVLVGGQNRFGFFWPQLFYLTLESSQVAILAGCSVAPSYTAKCSYSMAKTAL